MISKNAVSAFLLFSALMLSSLLIFQNVLTPRSAQAGISVSNGGYIAATIRDDSSGELIWLANLSIQRLSVYEADRKGFIEELAAIDLEELFRSGDGFDTNAETGIIEEAPAENTSGTRGSRRDRRDNRNRTRN